MMRKVFLISLVLIFAGLSSCSKDDNSSKKADIVGDWKVTSISLDNPFIDVNDFPPCIEKTEVSFKKDSSSSIKSFSGANCEQFTTTEGKYQVEGDKLHLSKGDKKGTITIKSVSNSSMTLNVVADSKVLGLLGFDFGGNSFSLNGNTVTVQLAKK